jgi:hypothetical protein
MGKERKPIVLYVKETKTFTCKFGRTEQRFPNPIIMSRGGVLSAIYTGIRSVKWPHLGVVWKPLVASAFLAMLT